jgi:hypothetical protein
LSIFTTKQTQVERELLTTESFVSSTSVNSTGSLSVDEYSHHMQDFKIVKSPVCVFGFQNADIPKDDEIKVSGILNNAEYVSSRTTGLNNLTTAKSFINGSGLVLIGKESSNGSKNLDELTFIHGNMSVIDYTEFGKN